MPNAAWVKLCQILMGFQIVSLMMMMMMITLIVLVYSWPSARGDTSVGVKFKIVCEFRVQFFIIIPNYTKELGTFEFGYKCTQCEWCGNCLVLTANNAVNVGDGFS